MSISDGRSEQATTRTRLSAQEQSTDVGVVNKKDITSTEDAANNKNALDVNIQTSQVSLGGGGGGTQYTEGDTDSTITGTAIMFESDTGTSTLSVVNDNTPLPTKTQGVDADGVAITGNPVLIGGEDSSGNIQNLQTAPDGDLITHHHTDSVTLSDGVSNSTTRIPVNESDFGFYATPIFQWTYNGTSWDRMRGDATDGLLVNLGTNNDVTVSGTATVTQAGDVEVVQPTHDDLNANANMQIGNVDVGGANPVPISDNGGSLTVDGSVAATQSGTWNINNVSGTVSLPTGAATAANQLPDGHNVTVDNGSGIAAVNIQDGGNVISVDDGGGSLTVDGAVTVSGTATVTQAGDVEVVQPTAADLNAQIRGDIASGAAISGTNPVVIAFQDSLGNSATPTGITAGAFNVLGTLPLDLSVHLQDFSASGEVYGLVASPNGTKASSLYLRTTSTGTLHATGNVAHDAAADGFPLVIGAVSEEDPDGPTAVDADADAVQLWSDRQGRLNVKNYAVESNLIDLTGLNDTFDNTTTSVNSSVFSTVGYRYGTFKYSIASANSPTRIRFLWQVENSDGSTYHSLDSGFWANFQYEDTAVSGTVNRAVSFLLPIAAEGCRIRIEATGTDASNTFTTTNCELELRT